MANGWTPERRARQARAIRRWRPWEHSTALEPQKVRRLTSKKLKLSVDRTDGHQRSSSDGLIDDVRICNRALSAAEVNKLYQMGR